MNIPGLSMEGVTASKAANIQRAFKLKSKGKDPAEEDARKEEQKAKRESRRQQPAAAAAPRPKLTVSEKNTIVDGMTQKKDEEDAKKKMAKLRKIRRYHEEFVANLGPAPKLTVRNHMLEIDAALDNCRHTMASKNAAKQIRQMPIYAAQGVEWAVQHGYDPLGWGSDVKGLGATMAHATQSGEMETSLTEMCIELEDWVSAPAWIRLSSQFLTICQVHVMSQRLRQTAATAAANPDVQQRMEEAFKRFQENADRMRQDADKN